MCSDGCQAVCELLCIFTPVSPQRVHLHFAPRSQGLGLWAGIDASGSLFELGWPKVASLLHGVWAAQHQAYLQGLQERLAGKQGLRLGLVWFGVGMDDWRVVVT